MTGILEKEKLGWEPLKKRRRHSRLVFLFKSLKSTASIPTDKLISSIRCRRNPNSLTFQNPAARADIYKGSFFPHTIRDWNALPDTIISAAEGAHDDVARFTSLVRARNLKYSYHRSWCMIIIRRVTSKSSDSSLFKVTDLTIKCSSLQ